MVVTAHDVKKSFQGGTRARGKRVEVLKGASLQVSLGEMVSIVGPSGSGKSTLLYCLGGLEAPDSGSIELMGSQIANESFSHLASMRSKHVGFIFQSYNLIPYLCVEENVALSAHLAGTSRSKREVRELLKGLGLSGKEKEKPGNLSGGERQRVAIARALATNAEIIFADEPTGALDSENSRRVLHLLRSIANGGKRSVVLVTHDLDAAALADRVLVMQDGVIREDLGKTTPSAILAAMGASA